MKRLAEITILASFLTVFTLTNINSSAEVKEEQETKHGECNFDTSELLSELVIEAEQGTVEDLQEEIAEEIVEGELELLAQLIEAEAGNQDELGKRYVADVVLNRVDSDLFPNTIEEVIYQDNQFSVIFDGAFEKAGWHISDESFRVSKEEYDGPRKNYDILYFTSGQYNSSGTPSFKHGAHYFSTR